MPKDGAEAKDERTIDEMAEDYTKRFLANLNRSAEEEEKDSHE
jgi:hypothetical protein